MSDFIQSIGAFSLRENGDLVNSCDEYNFGQNYSFDDFQRRVYAHIGGD